MNDRLLSLLGLARRAGKFSMGFDPVCDSAAKGEAVLVLYTADISEGSLKKLNRSIETAGVEMAQLPCEMEALACAIGKGVRIVSLNDAGFAKKAKLLLEAVGEVK